MRRNLILLAVVLLVIKGLSGHYFALGASLPGESKRRLAAPVRSDLKNLHYAMEAYFYDNSEFIDSIELIPFTNTRDVSVPEITLHPTGNGWSATAYAEFDPSITCEISVDMLAEDSSHTIPDPLCPGVPKRRSEFLRFIEAFARNIVDW